VGHAAEFLRNVAEMTMETRKGIKGRTSTVQPSGEGMGKGGTPQTGNGWWKSDVALWGVAHWKTHQKICACKLYWCSHNWMSEEKCGADGREPARGG